MRDPGSLWLMPVRFDDCVIEDLDIGGGRTLASIHSIDLFSHRSAGNLVRLVMAVQAILGLSPLAATATRAQPAPEAPPPRR